jgi:phosphatidate phosphatase LPIN
VSVNGQPIPFNMKIGEAGEAFFVFETEGDVPEELITSPILHATRPEQSMEDVQTDRFGARRREDADEGADVTERAESTEETQEPDFLDLNASTPTPPTTKQEPAKDHLTLSLPGASQSLPSPPHTPLLIPSDVLRQDNVGMDSLSLEIDKATESLVANGHAPEVIYTNGQ